MARTLQDVVVSDPDRLGGVPVFKGTRVPVKNLFDYIKADRSLETFLEHFPGVTRAQVAAVLDAAAEDVLKGTRAA